MLMFLGEYFKVTIANTQEIFENLKGNNDGKANVAKSQTSFFITYDILNSLGTACKMFIEHPRQELRISIALARNPYFQGPEQLKAIKRNIQKIQLGIISQCKGLYKFIDYIHDRPKDVTIKNQYVHKQPPKCILNALFFKMKADYMRYIYECLSGDNGLLSSTDCALGQKSSFLLLLRERNDNEIEGSSDTNDENYAKVDCDVCNPKFDQDQSKRSKHQKDSIENTFMNKELTLLEFMEHECNHEFEKAKRQIFGIDKKSFNMKSINSNEPTQFHPVFLSSLLNQQVFKRDVYMQKFQDAQEGHHGEKHSFSEKDRKEMNKRITENIQNWLKTIEDDGHFSNLNQQDKQMALNLFELLEKTVTNWESIQ